MVPNHESTKGMARRFVAFVAFVALAALSPAPIKEAPPPGFEPLKDHTESQLTEEQRRQVVKDEVGNFDPLTDKSDVKGENSSSDAEKTLLDATKQKSAAIVKEAGKQVHAEDQAMPPYIWGALFVALGFGSVYAFKFWLGKNIPGPAGPKKPVSW
jgi:hypothetical protein